MATPNITLALKPINILNITNAEVTDQDFTIYKLKDDGTGFIIYDSLVANYTVLASDVTYFTFSEDNLYKITFLSDPDNSYYILADQNIKVCEKALIKSVLCVPAKDCNTKTYYKLLEKRQRFYVLKNAIYSVYSKYITGLNSSNLGYSGIVAVQANYRVYLDALIAMCGCTTIKIDNCTSGELPSTNWTNLSSTDCGCN